MERVVEYSTESENILHFEEIVFPCPQVFPIVRKKEIQNSA